MNTNIFSKVIFGAGIIVAIGAYSANASCNDYQDKKSCQANKKCEWEKDTVAECMAGDNGSSDCWNITEKKECLANKNMGCSWYVGCRDKKK
jgi:hypothetical protein